MEITKREIVASISIIAIMLIIGLIIGGNINESNLDRNEVLYKALRVDNKETFQYGMDTNIGIAFVHGDLVAVDPVTYPEIGGEYLYIKKVKERYTMHTRTVTTRVNGKTTTRTQTYWTWDVVDREDKKSKEVTLLDTKFDSGRFSISQGEYIKTIKESSKIRYKYYGYPASSKITTLATLTDGDILEEKVNVYENMDIDQTIDYLEEYFNTYIFWFLWIVFIGFVVFGFYYLDNEWLHK